jgi:hypothetical protein
MADRRYLWCRTCGGGAGDGFVETIGGHRRHFVVRRIKDGKFLIEYFDGRSSHTTYLEGIEGAQKMTEASAKWHVRHNVGVEMVQIPAEMERGFREPVIAEPEPRLRVVR